MKQKFISIPFKSEKGLSEINGIAKFSSAGIIFEFESKLFGLVGGEVKEVRVSLDEILDLKFRKGFLKFFASVQLRLKNFAKLSELPNESGKVKLKIKREDFELAKEAVEQIEQIMGTANERSLPESNDQNDQLPPVQTSVNELFDTKKLDKKETKETNKLN